MGAESSPKRGQEERLSRLAWLPIPAFLAAIAVLACLRIEATWAPPVLLPTLNILFLTVVSFFVSFLAAKSHLAEPSDPMVFLGCGTLTLGLGAALAGLPLGRPGPNWTVTVYNTSACLAAACHLLSALWCLSGDGRPLRPGPPALALLYLAIVALIGLLGFAVHGGALPVFFVQGLGPTPWDLLVLWSAVLMFFLAGLLLILRQGRNRDVFHRWYSIGLFLIAAGLAGVSLQTRLGSPLNWVARASQYLGGVYMLIAIVASARRRGTWMLPLERALAESEGRYQALVTHSPEAILVHSGGNYVFANPAAARFLGARSPDEVIGREVMELLVPEEREAVAARIGKTYSGAPSPPRETRFLRFDGTPVFAEVMGARIEFAGKPAIQVFIRDISRRKQAEEEKENLLKQLHTERDRWRTTVENMLDPVTVCDAQGRVTYMNSAYQRLVERPVAEGLEIGNHPGYYQLYRPDGTLFPAEELPLQKAALTGAEARDVEIIQRSATGREFVAVFSAAPLRDASGRLAGAVAVGRDITEQRRAEERLRVSEARFRLLSETAGRLLAAAKPQAIVEELCHGVMTHIDCQAFFNFLVDEEAGRLHLNACAGIPPEEARKIEWLDYGVAVCGCVAREGRRIVAEDIRNTPDVRTELAKSYGIQAYACHPLKAQGRLIGTLSFGTKTRASFSPEDLALMKTVTDQVAVAMERMRLIAQLQSSRNELERRVRERTGDLILANEQLRTQNEEYRRVQDELRASKDHLRQLSSELLDAQEKERRSIAREIHDSLGASLAGAKFKMEHTLLRLGESNPEATAALKSVISVIQEMVREARRIQTALRPSMLDDLGVLATISSHCREVEEMYPVIRHVSQEIAIREQEIPDPLKVVIFRVMQEALNNVGKHSKGDGAVLALRRVGEAIEFSIRDSGQGFDLSEARSRKDGSRGLGLDSMRERVELSGGSFQIESTPGAGTVIRATWPVAEDSLQG